MFPCLKRPVPFFLLPQHMDSKDSSAIDTWQPDDPGVRAIDPAVSAITTPLSCPVLPASPVVHSAPVRVDFPDSPYVLATQIEENNIVESLDTRGGRKRHILGGLLWGHSCSLGVV